VIDPAAVEFTWTGKSASRYLLYHSTDPDFSDCEPIPVNHEQSLNSLQFSGSFFFLLIIPLGFTFRSGRKKLMGAILILLMVLLNITCHPSVNQSDTLEFSIVVENLQYNSTYYWKVTANATETLTSESIVRSFQTF
jgi:hypothetical protein